MVLMQKYFKLLLIIVLTISIILARHYGVAEYLSLASFKQNQLFLFGLTEKYILISILLYLLAYLATSLLQLPGITVLVLLAGALFGKLGGFALALISGTINALIVFWLARYIFHDYFQNKYRKQLKKFNSEFNRRGGVYIFLMHITPLLPYQLINIISGLTKVQAKVFVTATILGVLPHALLYTQLGYLLWSINSLKELFSPTLVVITLLAGILPFVYLGFNWQKK